MISAKTIGRLSLYRRLLKDLAEQGADYVYSHQLATMAGGTAPQVRRDIMSIGYTGSPTKGYEVAELTDSIGRFLDDPSGQRVALVGVGNLGRAIMAYFAGRRPDLTIAAAFDADPYKVDRVIHGCHCYGMERLAEIIEAEGISVGIITVPAGSAQVVADQLVRAGVRGIMNFAPTRLRVPPEVYVEDMDVTMTLDKVAYFARQGRLEKDVAK